MTPIVNRFALRITNPNSPFHTIVLACLVAVLCYLTTTLGWALMIRPQMLWPIWPGCAFLVAVLLLVPRKIWPVLIAAGLGGFFVYDLQVGLQIRPTIFLVLADIAEILIAALGVSYSCDGLPRLNSIKSLIKYSFFAVILAPLAAAFVSSADFGADYWVRWRIGFFTEALALLTLTPAILSWVSATRPWMPKSRAFYFEAATLIAGLGLLSYVAFVAPGHAAPPLAIYSLLPLLLWAALRFGLMGISTSMVVVALLSTWGAVHGRGPFTSADAITNVMSLQLFLFFAATTFMVLAVLVEEQKQTERAFRESEERFRLMADTAPALIWMSGTDKLCTYFNKPWLKFTGRSIELERGNGWLEGVHPEDLRRCMDTYTQAFDRREEFRMEYRLRRHDGEYRWIIDIGVPRFDRGRSFIGYIGSGVDVTERKHAEQALRESEERFRLAAQAGNMYAYEWDVATDVVTRSQEYATVIGFTDQAEQLDRQQVLASVHADDREKFLAAVASLTPESPASRVSYRMLRRDGVVVWVEKRARAFFDEQGRMIRMLGMVTDITERKRVEEALRESEAYLAEAQRLTHTGSGAWRVPGGDALYLSDEWYRIYGFDPKEGLSAWQDRLQRIHPEDRARAQEAKDRAIREKSDYEVDHRIVLPDGTVKYTHTVGHPVLNASGDVEQFVYTMVDVSERQRAEEVLSSMSGRLIEAQEQERTRIARELHDDLGQRLGLLANELEQLHQDTSTPPEVGGRAATLQKQATQLAMDIQTLSHELHSSKLEYLGIAAAMRAFCQEFGDQTKVKIDFKSHDLPSPLAPNISLCLFRVLQEALQNSLKHSKVRYVKVQLWGTSNEIHLTVSDSGAGFDSEAARQNRGLGLISMEERLKLVNGKFSIESQPKRGTTIHARVPVSSESDSMRAAG